MSLPNIIDIFNKFKASAMDDDNCEILQSGSFSNTTLNGGPSSGQNRAINAFFSEIELEWSRQFHAKASEQDPVTGQMYTDLMNDLLSLDLHSRIFSSVVTVNKPMYIHD